MQSVERVLPTVTGKPYIVHDVLFNVSNVDNEDSSMTYETQIARPEEHFD